MLLNVQDWWLYPAEKQVLDRSQLPVCTRKPACFLQNSQNSVIFKITTFLVCNAESRKMQQDCMCLPLFVCFLSESSHSYPHNRTLLPPSVCLLQRSLQWAFLHSKLTARRDQIKGFVSYCPAVRLSFHNLSLARIRRFSLPFSTISPTIRDASWMMVEGSEVYSRCGILRPRTISISSHKEWSLSGRLGYHLHTSVIILIPSF